MGALARAGLDTLCTWLRALLFMTNFRPVPLTEHVVFQGVAYRKVCRHLDLRKLGPSLL